ncbi:MAG: hypothetical protein KDA32_14215 [Phycisphaerales bacterium]|nr:hypothetical protein [Phycisphaerales bacterium]
MRSFLNRAALCGVGAVVLSNVAFAEPVMTPGYGLETWANVSDPVTLAFTPAGDVFVGRDPAGSGGSSFAATPIHHVGSAGGAATEFGSPVPDPDAVAYDVTGAITGVAGSVITGGHTTGGVLYSIAPNGTASTLAGPSTAFDNPNDFVVDGSRLLFTDISRKDVKSFSNGVVSSLFSMPYRTITIDTHKPSGSIFTSNEHGDVSVHTTDGQLVMAAFASGLGTQPAIAIEPDNSLFIPADDEDNGTIANRGVPTPVLFTLGSGELRRYTAPEQYEVLGTGFSAMWDIGFGPDGALYLADFNNDRVLRVVPEPTAFALLAVGGLLALRRR